MNFDRRIAAVYIYVSAGMQFEPNMSKSKCKQRLLEREARVLRDNVTNSEHVINKSRLRTDIIHS